MVLQRVSASPRFCGRRKKTCHGIKCGPHAVCHVYSLCSGIVGDCHFQSCLFRAAILVHAGHGSSHRSVSCPRGWLGGRTDRLRWCDGRHCLGRDRRLPARPWLWLRYRLPDRGQPSSDRVPADSTCHTHHLASQLRTKIDVRRCSMKITHVRTSVLRWRGKTKRRIAVYASRLYSVELSALAAEAKRYKDDGYRAMKLRFGWGPADGASGMQRNLELVRTVRDAVGNEIDVMADAYMGWSLDYAKRMLPLLEGFNLRWLEEPVIPDDIHGYAELKSSARIPIAGGEHEFTLYGFRELLEARALDYIQFDTNRVGGITQARKISALAEAHSVPVIPHAGQMHNYHVVMASLNSPMAEYFPIVDVEVGNELFWYIFRGEPKAKDGYIELDDNLPGLGLTIDEAALEKFEVIE